MSTSKPTIKPCYLKDAAELRKLNNNLLWRSLSETRDFIRNRQVEGIDIYLWSDESREGYFYLQNPMSQESWAIVYYESQSISAEDTLSIAEAIFNEFPALYRLDSYSLEENPDELSFKICKGQFDDDQTIFGRSFFSPQFAKRQVAFISWRFGYIALVSNKSGDKISSIDFVRREREVDDLIRSFALFYELFDTSGKIKEKKEESVLLKAPDGLQELHPVLTEAAEQIIAYLNGELHDFTFPYEVEEGTSFQKQVWEVTRSIPYAHLFSYKDIAQEIVKDEKRAIQLSRAVGQALGANPLPICIPCHRVVGKNRELTGFTGGVDVKDFLLNLEFLKYN